MSSAGTLTMTAISHLVFHWLMPRMPSTSLPLAFLCHHSMMPSHSLILHGSNMARFHWRVFISLDTVVIFQKEWSLTTEDTLPGHGQAAGWTEGSSGAVRPRRHSPPCPFCSEHRWHSVLLLLSQAGGSHWCSSLVLPSALPTPDGCRGTSPSSTRKDKRDFRRRTQEPWILMKES